MTILGFLTGSNPKRLTISRDIEGAPGLTLDAAVRQVPSREVNVTKNPVESGAKISDHATLGNYSFLLDGVVSEAPLPSGLLDTALGILAGAAGGLIGTAVGGSGLAGSLVTAFSAGFATEAANFALSVNAPESGQSKEFEIANRTPGDTDFPKKAWAYLTGLQQGRELLRIESGMVNLRQMLMTSLSAPMTIDKGKSIMFTAKFEELQIVKSATTSLAENLISKDATGAASKATLGKQATSAATPQQSESANQSILSTIFN